MTKLLIPLAITILLFGLFGFVLHWVKYKKGKSGCCGGGDHHGSNNHGCCGAHEKSQDHQCACEHK